MGKMNDEQAYLKQKQAERMTSACFHSDLEKIPMQAYNLFRTASSCTILNMALLFRRKPCVV